jgi:hypoxanthine phosphoribosyltransferase
VDTIRLGDKEFVPYIEETKIREAVGKVAAAISRHCRDQNPLFVCVLKGAVFFAADLVRLFDFPADLTFIRAASYCNLSSTEDVEVLQPLIEPAGQRDVVVIDDVMDTGYTYRALKRILLQQGVRSVRLACLLYKPGALKCPELQPDFFGIEIGNDFVVGYGLDYNEMGRTLKDIYVLKG